MEDKNKIKDKVSEILKKKQESKEFKDTNIVGYTKKYKRNYDIVNSNNLSEIEDDPINAYKQVEKSKVWQKYNIEEQKEKGYSSGATYLKVKCRESLSSRPFDSKDARNVYVTNIERLKIILEGCFTAKSVEDELYKFIRNKDFFVGDTSDLDGKSWQYSRKIDKKLTSIFGVRFINFCKRHSDSAIADFKKAELFDPYTKEQQDEYINKELIRLNKLLIEKNNDLEEAKNKSKEHIERQVRSKYAHLFTSRKAFDEKVLSDFEGLKKIYLSGYENQVKFTVQAIESYTQRKDLKDQYVVRDNNWDWAFGENQQIERKKSNSPKINTKLPLSHITRTGGYEIPSIEVDSVTKTFGFNNVVFGNALKDTESREHIKHFLGAITDLAEMLDIDIFAINQLGKLDINFATMGVAGHMATYFPAYKAINLTKKSGDGSVAHEWFHYFDNVIQEGSERRATSVLASESCSQNSMGTKLAIWNLVNYILKGDGETNQITVRFEAQDKVRYHAYSDTLEGCIEEIQERYKIYAYKYDDPSVIKYYGFLAHKFQKAYIDVPMTLKTSIYYYNSSRIGSKYWVEPAELCARAFESYIEAILDLKDRKNNYLVSYKNNWIFTPQDEIPYPQGRELEKIIVLFDNIFKAFKQEYNVSDFKPFSEKRVSEYIEIKDNSKKEKTTKTDTDMPIMERLPQSVEDIKTENLPIEQVSSIEQDNADDKDYQLVVAKLKDLFSTYKLDKNNKEIASQLYSVFAHFLYNYLSKGYFEDINLFFEINAELPKKFKEFVDLNDAEYTDFGSNLISKGVNIWNHIPESYKQVADIKKVNYTISKDDEKLLSLFTPFVLKDDMFGGSRLLMEGVSFDEYGVVATDAHKLLFIPAEHEIRGTYCSTKKCFKDAENVQPLEQNQNSSSNKVYPKYQSVVPSNKNTLDLNAYSLLSFLNAFQKSNLVNEQSGVIILLIEEIYFGFNLERLKDCVEAIVKLGYSEITLSFSDTTYAVCITPKGMYDGYKIKSLQIPFALIMPTNIDGVGYQSQNKNRWFYFDCNNESFMQKDSQPISLNPMVIKEKALEEKTKKLENLFQEVSEKLEKIEAKEKEIIQTPIEKQKTYLTDITILWSEGLEKDNIKCETLADLQRYLRKAFGDLNPNEGYVKTKVLFTFDNGDTLEKRIDLGYSKGDFNPKETIIQDYIDENILSWNPMDKSTRDLEQFEYVFEFKESPITEQAPIVEEVQEVEQPKQKPTVEELQERISIIKRMIAKGKGNKEELQERISIIERMIKKYSKFAQGGLIDGASQDYLYRLLSRLQEDCEYFLNAGGRNEKHLWSGSVDAQIKDMKDIYNRLDVKPDWLTMEQIEFYSKVIKYYENLNYNNQIHRC